MQSKVVSVCNSWPERAPDVRKTGMQSSVITPQSFPKWLPDAVRLYLDHTEDGMSLRALARRDGRHASTVLRQVRRYENRRDDPLLDEALTSLSQPVTAQSPVANKDFPLMSAPLRSLTAGVDEKTILQEARRVLRRLAEPGAVMAIAPDMEKAVVMREAADGSSARTAVVDRVVAQAFVLKDWISCRKVGRVSRYDITPNGRAAVRRLCGVEANGFAEAQAGFSAQDGVWDQGGDTEATPRKRMRYSLSESPIAVLARRRDKDGKRFLETPLVEAAERLREDFELAQMGPRVTQNWERFLTGTDRGYRSDSDRSEAPSVARDRVAAALRDLGPGLGDVALRVCCFLEGVETAEQSMGWAARSGKIVLRIALMRLRRHYDETYGKSGPLIG